MKHWEWVTTTEDVDGLIRANEHLHDRVTELETREAERTLDEEAMYKYLHNTVKALKADIKALKKGTQGGCMGRETATSISANDYQATRDRVRASAAELLTAYDVQWHSRLAQYYHPGLKLVGGWDCHGESFFVETSMMSTDQGLVGGPLTGNKLIRDRRPGVPCTKLLGGTHLGAA